MENDRTSTKSRLLDAAEILFAQKVFEDVSIRELAAAASVNVAAVNYHFQGKDKLYEEVVRRRFIQQRGLVLKAIEKVMAEHEGNPPLEDFIRSFVSQTISSALSNESEGSFLRLVLHGLHAQGKHASPLFFKEMVTPVFEVLSKTLHKVKPDIEPDRINWILASLVAQIHHFIFRWQKFCSLEEECESREIMLMAFPALGGPDDQYAKLAIDHITLFTTAAIEALYPEVSS